MKLSVPSNNRAGGVLWPRLLVLLLVLVFLSTDARAGVGDPLPRVMCASGYSATVYAQGLSSPDGLAFSPGGVLHVAEENADRISRLEVYGRANPIISGLNKPEGITFDDIGNLYVVEDVADGRVIMITPDGVPTTLSTNHDAPEGVVWAPGGTLYITESTAEFSQTPPFDIQTRVTAIAPGGSVTTLRNDNWFWSYAGITMGSDGALYVTNEASGTGTDDSIFVIDPDTGSRAMLSNGMMAPEGLRFSINGGFPLYVAEEDTGSGGGRLSRVGVDGSHIPFCSGFSTVEDVALDKEGRLFVSEDGSGSVVRIEPGLHNRAHPKAIILLIGDGMGEAQRIAGRWGAVGQSGALAMDVMSFGGWTRTASADSPVTDSAAASTAIATGIKTNNGVIGLDPAGNPLTTILERAKARGMAVGLVTNTHMTHATPAAFAARVPSRTMMTEIASQMLAAGVDVLLGGGEDVFLPETAEGCFPEPGERTDGRNLINEAIAAGYTHVCDVAGLTAVTSTPTTRLLGLFADEGMTRPFSPSLAEMTQKAIDILAQDADGFFLMVEGGQIDWVGHLNDGAHVIEDVIGFDEAVGVARAYADAVENTLIIVTADHETGGMQVGLTSSGALDEDGPFYMPGGRPFFVNWSTFYHTGVDVPTTAQGPWADWLTGIYENTHIHDVMRMALENSPDISLTKMAVPSHGSRVTLGDRITYTLVLTNSGLGNSTGLVLTDVLPAGVQYVSGSVTAANGLNIATTPPSALVFTGTLAAGKVLTATFQVTVADRGVSTIVNAASMISHQTTLEESNPVIHLALEPGTRQVYLPVVFEDFNLPALAPSRQ